MVAPSPITPTRTTSFGPPAPGSAPVISRGTPSARPATVERFRKVLRGIGFILLLTIDQEPFRANRRPRVESQGVRCARHDMLQDRRLPDAVPHVKQRYRV